MKRIDEYQVVCYIENSSLKIFEYSFNNQSIYFYNYNLDITKKRIADITSDFDIHEKQALLGIIVNNKYKLNAKSICLQGQTYSVELF